MIKVGLLLPAYNEEKNIQSVIRDVKKYLPDSEILVVDDGSRDKTYQLASRMGVKVLKHEKNRGKGEALKSGFKYFLNRHIDFVVVIDTDRQFAVKDGLKILNALESGKGDFVGGYRIPSDIPYANRAGNFLWRIIFNLFFGTKLKDIGCGFIGLNKNALKKMKNVYGGYIIESSMLINCINKKLGVFQVPVKVYYKNYYERLSIKKFSNMFLTVSLFIVVNGMRRILKSS
jgi:glycosyltransferase involved in cell wall biosynthesis